MGHGAPKGLDMKIIKEAVYCKETGRKIEDAIGQCNECPRQVELSYHTNTCECGADYNGWGQQLAPREQWGEETGEHWTDCI